MEQNYKNLSSLEQNKILTSFGYAVGFDENLIEEAEVDNFLIWIHFSNDTQHLEFPTKFVVCYTCEGRGKHTNPAIDGQGITQSEMEELGEEFERDYFSGVYDITCLECKGKRVVKEIDLQDSEFITNTILRQAYLVFVEEQIKKEDLESEYAYEKRMGC